MNAPSSRRLRRGRGQVLVLACATFLLLALTLMASFSISHAVHERIRIQAAADAHAFSIATLEARGFNTIGYMNRAIAGGIVAEMGLHAWRAIALRDISMYQAGFISFLMVAALEFAQCPKFKIQHCIHGIQALKIAFKYRKQKSATQNELESKDQQWKDAVKGFSDMIKDINKDQKDLLKKVKTAIGPMSPVLRQIANTSAPQASIKMLGKLNESGLACAVEGSDFDDDCDPPSWKTAGTVSSASERTQIMESAALAARPIFEQGRLSNRNLSGSGYRTVPVPPLELDLPIPAINPQKMMDIQSEGTYIELGITKENNTLSNNKISSTVPMSMVFVQWKHGFGMYFTKGTQSDSMGQYEGVPCDGSGGCFINFRMGKASTASDDSDYGQPATYGAIQQDLRALKNGGKGNWEIDDKGEVNNLGNIKKDKTGKGTFKYVSDNQAYAVAKGKTYFHQLGQNGWEVPPNMFDPFWRAKLQPFIKDELKDVLTKAGDTQGVQVVSGGGPVEGVVK